MDSQDDEDRPLSVREARVLNGEVLLGILLRLERLEKVLAANRATLAQIREALAERLAAGQPNGCLADIQTVLGLAGKRLTTAGILDALAAAGLDWSESTVKGTLSAAVDAGNLTNDQRANPKGYALAVAVRPAVPPQSDCVNCRGRTDAAHG
jgi:hypothetical protein